jgi:hypothetical protein
MAAITGFSVTVPRGLEFTANRARLRGWVTLPHVGGYALSAHGRTLHISLRGTAAR